MATTPAPCLLLAGHGSLSFSVRSSHVQLHRSPRPSLSPAARGHYDRGGVLGNSPPLLLLGTNKGTDGDEMDEVQPFRESFVKIVSYHCIYVISRVIAKLQALRHGTCLCLQLYISLLISEQLNQKLNFQKSNSHKYARAVQFLERLSATFLAFELFRSPVLTPNSYKHNDLTDVSRCL